MILRALLFESALFVLWERSVVIVILVFFQLRYSADFCSWAYLEWHADGMACGAGRWQAATSSGAERSYFCFRLGCRTIRQYFILGVILLAYYSILRCMGAQIIVHIPQHNVKIGRRGEKTKK